MSIIIIFLLSLLVGPILYFNGKKIGLSWQKNLGLGLWIVGWGFLAWMIWGILHIAG
jgi:hypothetical protein